MAYKRSYSNGPINIVWWISIAMLLVLLDQLTKIWITSTLKFGQGIELTSFFSLILVYNEGAAFSFLASQSGWQRYFFTFISIIAIIGMLYLMRKHPERQLFCFSLALILGGAIGNLIDRSLYGHVIDFLDVHAARWHWPTFNIADCGVSVGAVLFIIDEFRHKKR